MKTITEFEGFGLLRDAFKLRQEWVRNKRKSPAQTPTPEPVPAVETVATEAATTDATPETQTAADAQAAPETAESTAPIAETASTGETIPEPVVAPSDAPSVPPKKIFKLKTREEVDAEIQKVEDALKEDLGKVFTEKFKVDGDRLALLFETIRVVDTRRINDLKRIVVYTATDGEKVPSEYIKSGNHYFRAEYLAPLHNPRNKKRDFGDKKRFPKNKKRFDKKRKPSRGASAGQNAAPSPESRPAGPPRKMEFKPPKPASETPST